MDISDMNLSFAGCGFLCIYHAGVCAAIKEYAPQLTRNKISGASAGAIAAAGLICNVCLSEATSIILQVVCKARAGSLQALSPNFNLIGMIRQGLEKTLPADAHILCNGKLFISLTRARDYKNVIVSEYNSKEELIQAILCSSFIPFYCGRTPPEYRGEAYLDGGISDNQPVRDANTISVSPFSGESDICPTDLDSASFLGFNFYGTSIQFTTQNLFRMLTTLFPPAPEICSRICRQGFEDTLKFLTKNAMTPCAQCLTIQSNALPLPQYKNNVRKNNLRGFQGVNRPNSLEIKSSTKKIRVDECGTCFERLENGSEPQFSKIPLPKVVQQTLDDAAAAEGRLFRYLRSFRAFRWAMRFMTPVILPCEITLFIIRTLRSWLSKYSTTDFYLLKLQRMVDFVLHEIDNKRLLYEPTRVSCQFAITDLEDAVASKYQSRLDLSEAGMEASSLSASHRSSSRLASTSALNIPLEDIEVSGRHIPTPMCALPDTMLVEDEDTVAQLHDYSLNHDAVLAFYYKDEETNQVKVCEIYDMQNPDRPIPCHSTGVGGRKISCKLPHAHINEMMEIDEDDENKAKTCPSDLRLNEEQGGQVEEEENQFPLDDLADSVEMMQKREAAEDSGLSFTDSPYQGKEKQDAYCSPVRLSDNKPMKVKESSPLKNSATESNETDSSQQPATLTPSNSRRNTMNDSRKSMRSTKSTGNGGAKKSGKVAVQQNSSTSSDCDDNESLFVPAKSSSLVSSNTRAKKSKNAATTSLTSKITKNGPPKS